MLPDDMSIYFFAQKNHYHFQKEDDMRVNKEEHVLQMMTLNYNTMVQQKASAVTLIVMIADYRLLSLPSVVVYVCSLLIVFYFQYSRYLHILLRQYKANEQLSVSFTYLNICILYLSTIKPYLILNFFLIQSQ